MPATSTDLWAAAVGQDDARRQLEAAARNPVHAYLLLGPEGWGTRAVAAAFAGDVLGAGLDADGAERIRALIADGNCSDLFVIEPEGNVLRKEEVDELIRRAYQAPTEAAHKVLVLPRFDTAGDIAWSRMLKVLEEPPPSTVWVLLAEDLEEAMTTVVSRCIVVNLQPVGEALIAAALEAEGHRVDTATTVAKAASGDLALARLLVSDERLALRVAAWRQVPSQLDGTGHAAWRLVAELRAAIDDSLVHVKSRFDAAEAELAARIEELGLPKGQLRLLADSHKRQLRRARTAELRMGLATLGARYRDAVADGTNRPPAQRARLLDSIGAIDEAYEALAVRNANEALQLQALFLRLPGLA